MALSRTVRLRECPLGLISTDVVTKTWNDLKPPKTMYNLLQPPQKIQQPPTTIYNRLKNIYNHSQII